MIERFIRQEIEKALEVQTAVVLSGLPRVGRTTLANSWIVEAGNFAISFDANRYLSDFADTRSFLEMVAGHLVVIENIAEQTIDSVARLVRGAADGKDGTRFLLMLQRQALFPKLATSLAGLVRGFELCPVQPDEAFCHAELLKSPPVGLIVGDLTAAPADYREWNQDVHWLRGGLPQSLEAVDDDSSFQWRRDYNNALLSGDFGDWSLGPADRVLDVLGRIVAAHGQIFDEDKCRSELGLDRKSLRGSLNMLVGMGLVRMLPNVNRGGNAVFYVRDSGLFHAMSGVRTREQLRGDKLHGHSWESFATEALILASGDRAKSYFYRDKEDDEIDLVLDFNPAFAALFAFEFKVSDDVDPEAGFWRACQRLQPTHRLVVHSHGSFRRCAENVEAISLLTAIERVRSIFSPPSGAFR